MASNHSEDLGERLIRFLMDYKWMFNFSNVKVLLVHQTWPEHWKEFMRKTKVQDFKNALLQKTVLENEFVMNFINERNKLLIEIEQHYNIDKNNCHKIIESPFGHGMNPKKKYEVKHFGDLIIDNETVHDLIIDVGSGAGHLERYLISKKLDESKMICIESSNSHVESADKWLQASNKGYLISNYRK